MKKWQKIILDILCLFVICVFTDIVSIYTRDKPIFAYSDNDDSVNKVYKGLLYDTYNCFEESMVHIKPKWINYSCKYISNDTSIYGVITDIKDNYITIEGTKNTNNLKIGQKAHIKLSADTKIIGSNNIITGQKIRLDPNTIQETYPITITTKEILIITTTLGDFKIEDETKMCDEALEEIYDDGYNKYYLTCIKSHTIFIKFSNGERYNVKDSLDNGYITIKELIDKNFNMIIEPQFKLNVAIKDSADSSKQISDYKLIYKNVESVSISTNNVDNILLEDALLNENITKDNLIKMINHNVTYGESTKEMYKDGGSILYKGLSYNILICNTTLCNKDIYIGNTNMVYEEDYCK